MVEVWEPLLVWRHLKEVDGCTGSTTQKFQRLSFRPGVGDIDIPPEEARAEARFDSGYGEGKKRFVA